MTHDAWPQQMLPELTQKKRKQEKNEEQEERETEGDGVEKRDKLENKKNRRKTGICIYTSTRMYQ